MEKEIRARKREEREQREMERYRVRETIKPLRPLQSVFISTWVYVFRH